MSIVIWSTLNVHFSRVKSFTNVNNDSQFRFESKEYFHCNQKPIVNRVITDDTIFERFFLREQFPEQNSKAVDVIFNSSMLTAVAPAFRRYMRHSSSVFTETAYCLRVIFPFSQTKVTYLCHKHKHWLETAHRFNVDVLSNLESESLTIAQKLALSLCQLQKNVIFLLSLVNLMFDQTKRLQTGNITKADTTSQHIAVSQY